MRGVLPEIFSEPAPSVEYDASPWSASNQASFGSMPVKLRDLPLSQDEVHDLPPLSEG